ncbi:AraC family transcriptional regulator [Rhodohalobacter sp. SW132]|uniref:helix-turn-helix domain-containing protein n=1 Tax=Rhodohalobacter sp. SW132 TaxID=2293433 RepID=UPI000E24CE7E|nr:helix-turn-helix domain-containing protein [Rhodohalobacter sp. SW132]REL32885.1 AraC family transcriptional regulator [Rhodohalobacter sp. SW132]
MFGSTLNSNNTKDSESNRPKLYVKYMVCLRDKLALKSVLTEQDLTCSISVHGAIECLEEISEERFQNLKTSLAKSGLILLDEKDSMLIDRIIQTIVEVIHYSDTLPKLNFRDLISKQTVSGNESILKIFSDVKGMSVLQFIILQKIERAKELMLYEDKTLEEIAEILNYKNKDYLVAQFKKTTGLTPHYFERLKKERLEISEDYIKSPNSDAARTSH